MQSYIWNFLSMLSFHSVSPFLLLVCENMFAKVIVLHEI